MTTTTTPTTQHQQQKPRAAEDAWFSRPNIQSFLLAFHATADSLDAEAFSGDFFTDDVEVQYANNPVVKGREANKLGFEWTFANLELMRHQLVYFDVVAPMDVSSGDKVKESKETEEVRIYQAARIRYVVKGDDVGDAERVVDVPAFLVGWVVREGVANTHEDADANGGGLKFRRMEVYLDVSRVFARMAEKGLL